MPSARRLPRPRLLVCFVTAATIAGSLVAGPAAAAPPGVDPSRQVSMPDGGHIALDADGAATRTDAHGNVLGRTTILVPSGTSAVGGDWAPTDEAVRATFAQQTAEPGKRVSAMSTGPKPLPAQAVSAARTAARTATPKAAETPLSALPTNYGLTTSGQSFLNAGGTNAIGAFSLLQEQFGQLPGAGQIITNVSIGDLTDQSMADAGDNYVRGHGPTTIVRDGQRYLDLPALPLIPTYTAGPDGRLDPVGSTEGQDAQLGEVLLDFGVMAPLPHDRQRPEATGDGLTDLLGIAPGAQYRLVVPKEPTFDQIAVALLAAARQVPRPDVITASLGFGTDTEGFPGRYLEDDPVIRNVISTIVRQYHIVVTISSNDGTRLYTPTAVGPDGGSTPTDLVSHHEAATEIDDVARSTTPTLVPDSGAIAVGGTTLDDIASVPGPLSHNPTFATTRTNGGTTFSSGFGTRLNVSAPSDGILVYEHTGGGAAQDVTPVLNGGTSASAPMVAAAAAVVLQASELTGHRLSPTDVRAVLERTGRAVASPPQLDRKITVGPQLDVTAAVNEVLDDHKGHQQPRIARLSVAHRVVTGGLGTSYLESTDPDRIDLQTGGTGEGLVGPVTIGADVVGSTTGKTDYVLSVNGHDFHSSLPAVRLTPTELLGAAGLPVVSDQDRDVRVTFEVRDGKHVVASAAKTLTIGPTDGTYAEALAPVGPATVRVGSPVTVHYDLTGVRNLSNPQLVVSTLGHWNPLTAPLFGTSFVAPINDSSGDVEIPASAFIGGGGIYGIGIVQRSVTGSAGTPTYGEFTAIRVDGGTADHRPPAPTLGTRADHTLEIRRAEPSFSLRYDVRSVPGAIGAAVEFSAPAPTLYNALNTFTNANGDSRDQNGVNAGSVAYRRLPARTGVASLNAVDLGLGGSVAYNVRVFGTDGSGRIVGQASASSLLTVDDGLAPGDGRVTSFAAQPEGTSFVALRTPGGGESVLEYDAATGNYGDTITTDPSANGGYQVLGADPQAHRLVVLHFSPAGSALETYDTGARTLVSRAATDGYTVRGGRVDGVRHRAAILALRTEDGADVVLPLALATGTLSPAIPADPPGAVRGGFKMIELDRQTGTVYLSRTSSSLICIGGGAGSAVSVDLETGALRLSDSGSVCANGLALDEGTGRLYQLSYRSFSLNIVGTTSISVLAGDTMTTAAPTIPVRQQQASYLAIDGVHHLGLVAFRTPPVLSQFGRVGGVVTDSNATSQLAVIDLATGQQVSVVSGLNFVSSPFGGEYNSLTERAVQLDPSTRTGWVPSADGRQLQQFRY